VTLVIMGLNPIGRPNPMEEDIMLTDPSGCPCCYTTPCKKQCTCAHPYMSGGCDRCASYGSLEQRKAAAERLAKIIDAAKEPR
jgi:hypothetical protein